MSPPEVDELRELITAHNGNLSAMRAALLADKSKGYTKLSRQTVAIWLRDANLEDEAATARAVAGVPGPRLSLPAGSLDAVAEKAAITEGMESTKSLAAAAAKLGISRRSLYRRRQALGVQSDRPKRAAK